MENIEYEFDAAKSTQLRKERGLGFEEMITLMETGYVIKTYPHPNRAKYPHQEVYAVNVSGYVWLVMSEKRGDKIRLITFYPSSKETKKWLKEFENG